MYPVNRGTPRIFRKFLPSTILYVRKFQPETSFLTRSCWSSSTVVKSDSYRDTSVRRISVDLREVRPETFKFIKSLNKNWFKFLFPKGVTLSPTVSKRQRGFLPGLPSKKNNHLLYSPLPFSNPIPS